jgi:hypothetical protein
MADVQQELVTVRAKPTVPIPHVVNISGKEYIMNPDAKVPKAWGEAHCKAYPGSFELNPKGSPNKDDYRVKESFRTAMILDRIILCTQDQQKEVLAFIDEIRERDRQATAVAQAKAEKAAREELARKDEAQMSAKREGRA